MNNWSRRLQSGALTFAILAGFCHTVPAAESLDTLLQRGLFEEEANHNLPAAIKAYEDVIAQTDEQRKLAATAVFRLGECYRKLGKTNEAMAQYQRVVRDFAEQEQLVKLSREVLNQKQIALVPPVLPSDGSVRFEDRLRSIVAQASGNYDAEGEKIRSLAAVFRDNPDRVNARDTNQRTPLHEAVANGESRVVTFLLTNGASLELRDKDSMTPLLLATKQGHKEIVEQLLQAKADPNGADSYGATPAHYAANDASRAILLLLIKARGNVDAKGTFRNISGVTPLHVAALRGYRAVAELLLEADANPNARNAQGQTPLHIASTFGHDPVVELLLDRKADVNAKDNEQRTALHLATVKHTSTVKLLLKAKADANARERTGWTPLFHAVKEQQLEIVQLLIKNGADVNAATPRGQTPLLIAAEANAADIAEMLLTAGANVNARFDNGYASLNLAANRDDVIMLGTLFKFKPELEPRDSEGFTPLQRAVWNNRTEAVRLLLEAGADPNNALPSEGKTALHLSVQKNSGEITAMLLAHKADPNIADKSGRTPFDLVSPSGGPSAATYPPPLPPAPVPTASSLPLRVTRQPVPGQAAVTEPNELRELLLKHGADTNIARRGAIAIARNDFLYPWYRKGENAHNRYTLFEFIANFYDPSYQTANSMPFPDLSRVTVHRLATNAVTPNTDSKFNVTALLREGDCSKDVWLDWGDIVTIPEQEHPLSSAWQGFDETVAVGLSNCLQRQIFVIVKGRTNELSLRPRIVGPAFRVTQTQFLLSRTLLGSALLLSTSDTSQITVHRADPVTKEKLKLTFDLSRSPVSPDLWLRDGDTVEVPEKSRPATASTP